MKTRSALFFAIAAVLVVAGVLFMASLSMPPVSWESTFSRHDRMPYGSYLVNERLKDLFPGEKIAQGTKPASEELYEAVVAEEEADATTVSTAPGNIGAYLLIGSTYPVSEDDLDAILSYVRQGGTVVLSDLRQESDPLTRFLGLSRSYTLGKRDTTQEPHMTFVDVASGEKTTLPGEVLNYYFYQFGLIQKGKTLIENEFHEPVFVQIPYGAGNFYACAVPHLFTNYYLLKPGGDKLLASMLSHIPVTADAKVMWDESYKHVAQEREAQQRDLFQFIHKHPTLEWGFYLLLVLIGAYILSEMRRKQREIPVIEPLPNATLEFAGTIGSLYFRNKDHKNIAEKKIRYFHEYIRTRFFLRIHEADDTALEALAGRSGVAAEELMPLLRLMANIRQANQITEDDLVDLSARLDRFYQQTS